VTHDDLAETLVGLKDWCEGLETILTPSNIGNSSEGFSPAPRGHDDHAMLQYTSGSTGHPKGVELTHGCLLWNLDAIQSGVGSQPNDVCVSWLPLYHDMGLIGGCLYPLASGIGTNLMATEVFLTEPSFWLQALSMKAATITVAPNFGYALSVKRVKDEVIADLNLSSVRVMLCGAEPIDPEVLSAFQDRFASAGLPSDVILPVYGLAEATLAATFTATGEPVKVAMLDRAKLEQEGLAQDTNDLQNAVSVVSVGTPLLTNRLRIIGESGEDLTDDHQGEILIQSESLMRGYFRNPEATERTIQDGWLHTGDLGFLRDGELYITGRIKDLIITYGRNFYPHDIERIAQRVDGVRTGCVVCFATHNEEESTDEIAIVAETRSTDRKELIEMRREIRKLLINSIECNPTHVMLVPPGQVPKTTSGKLRRNEARRLFLANEFSKLL
jgi:acyl-CoA synthetase (AMP-forming)/AMP-acid ligase II